MNPESSLGLRPTLRRCAGGALLLVLSRVAILVLIGRAVDAREFTSDVATHMNMVRHPLQILLGHTAAHGQYPPLLPILEALFARPLLLLTTEFYALRLTYVLYEGLAFFFFCLTAHVVVEEARQRRWACVAFVVLPMGWISSAIMAQDEVIAACFLMVVLWLVAVRRNVAALATCSLAVVAAKIFMLLPLLVLLPNLQIEGRWKRFLAAFGPCGLFYGAVVIVAWARGTPLPLVDFVPRPYFGVNVWATSMMQATFSPDVARRWSALATLFTVTLLVLGLRKRVEEGGAIYFARFFPAVFLWFLTLFYHVNPEYYVLMFFPFLLVVRGRFEALLIALLSVVPWCVNFLFGMCRATAGHAEAGRQDFVAFYSQWTSVAPQPLFAGMLWLNVALTFVAALAVTGSLFRLFPRDRS